MSPFSATRSPQHRDGKNLPRGYDKTPRSNGCFLSAAGDHLEEIQDATVEANPEVAERHAEITEDVDDLLDEIDSVLEENAEEFVRGYVQKGGQ